MDIRLLVRATRRLVLLGLGGVALGASAAYLNSPVPANAYITKGGLDWAWASPVSASWGALI